MKVEQMRMGAFSKAQLAMLFFPDQSKQSALRSFRRLIIRNKLLNEILEKNNEYKFSHILSPKLVGIIFEYLGNPYELAY